MSNLIRFNGKTYLNLDEMPPDVRQAYQQIMDIFADKNQNGIPDMQEGDLPGARQEAKFILADENHNGTADIFETAQEENVIQRTTFVVDGKSYQSPADMPAEARQRYQAAMSKIDANPDNLTVWLQHTNQHASENKHEAGKEMPAWLADVADQPNLSYPSTPAVIEPEGADLRLVAIGCAAVAMVLAAVGVVLLLGLQ